MRRQGQRDELVSVIAGTPTDQQIMGMVAEATRAAKLVGYLGKLHAQILGVRLA